MSATETAAGTESTIGSQTELLAPKPVVSKRRAAGGQLAPMVWKGGPVMAWPELVSLFWGDFEQAQITAMQTYLASYAAYLQSQGAPAGQRCVVAQYDIAGARPGASYVQAAQPQNATEAEARSLIETLQQQGHLPSFAANRLFLVFTHGMTFSGYGTEWCGYHGSWGTSQYFAIVPYPAAGGCGSNAPEASWQSVTSHEINEAATDPGVGSGWITGNEEGGDTCAWQEFNMSFGTIQLFEDNKQSSCSAWTPRTGQMWHTIRNPDGSWQPDYGLVEGQEANNPGPFTAASCAGVGEELQLVGLSADGRMWHTIRNPDGTWQGEYGLVEGQERNDPGPFKGISCAGVAQELQLAGISEDGRMWHTIRNPDGTWQGEYGLVEGQERNDPGPFIAVACAGVAQQLQLVGLSEDGRMWHTIRNPDGSWQPEYGLVEGQERNDPGPFIALTCAGVGGELQLAGLAQDGRVWHTIRHADATWQSEYGLVESQVHNNPGPFLALGCAGVGQELQLIGLSQSGQMWHTIRRANGTWQGEYGLVEGHERNDPGPFITVSCTGVGAALQTVGLA